MSVNINLRMLHSNEEYVGTVFKETILPIRSKLCELLEHELRPYQREFSDRLINATLRGRNEEIAIMESRQCVDGNSLILTIDGKIDRIKNIGFSTGVNDVYKVKQLEKHGVTGMIIGKALYSESIKFEDAVKIGELS